MDDIYYQVWNLEETHGVLSTDKEAISNLEKDIFPTGDPRIDELILESDGVAHVFMESVNPNYQFRIPLPEDRGIATVKQNDDGKFFTWVINDGFTDGGYQVYKLFDSFVETVLFIVTKLIPEPEANRDVDPYEGMAPEQMLELQEKANKKILRNAVPGHLKIAHSSLYGTFNKKFGE